MEDGISSLLGPALTFFNLFFAVVICFTSMVKLLGTTTFSLLLLLLALEEGEAPFLKIIEREGEGGGSCLLLEAWEGKKAELVVLERSRFNAMVKDDEG